MRQSPKHTRAHSCPASVLARRWPSAFLLAREKRRDYDFTIGRAPIDILHKSESNPGVKTPLRARAWLPPAMWILAVIAAVVLLVRAQQQLEQPLGVFPSYYTAAKLIERGEDIGRFYDTPWFRDWISVFAPGTIEMHNANTPFMGFFFLPLTAFDYETARRITSVLVFVALAAATYLMTASLNIAGAWRAAAFAFVFAAPASLMNLSHAQVYPIVLVLLVLAWRAWRRGAEWTGGFLIGVSLAWKTAGLFLLPLMVLERRWRALAAVVAVFSVLAVVTFPVVRATGWDAYFNSLTQVMDRGSTSLPAFWSLSGFVRNLFKYDALFNPDPYVDAPMLAFVLEAGLFLAFVLAATRVAMVTKNRDVTFAAFVMLSLILVPVTSRSHTVLGFLPAFIILAQVRNRLLSPLGISFLIGSVLSFAPAVERLSALASWGGALFFYPRFFGLVTLMIVLVILGHEHVRSAISEPVPNVPPQGAMGR